MNLTPFRRASRVLVYGHRGARGPVPENTLAAFAFAANAGADGVELDVRQCESGEVVVLHDLDFARVTQGRDVRRIAALSWSEVEKIDLGGGERAPLLSEVLDFAATRGLRVNVEMKRDLLPSGWQWRERLALVRAVVPIVRGREAVCVSSFDPLMLLALGRWVPDTPRCMLFHEGQVRYLPWDLTALGGFQGFNAEHTLISRYSVDFAHARGATVNAWTVDDPEEIARLDACGVDGIITDRPDLFAAQAALSGAAH
jgi:glycerophosphoryl diester phosphodiesterase